MQGLLLKTKSDEEAYLQLSYPARNSRQLIKHLPPIVQSEFQKDEKAIAIFHREKGGIMSPFHCDSGGGIGTLLHGDELCYVVVVQAWVSEDPQRSPSKEWYDTHRGACMFSESHLRGDDLPLNGEVGVTELDGVMLVLYYRSLKVGDIYAFDASGNNDTSRK